MLCKKKEIKEIKEIYNIFHVQLFELSKKISNTPNFQVYTYFLLKKQTNLNAENRFKNRSQARQICRIKGNLRETHKLQNINSICPTRKFTLVSYRSKLKAYLVLSSFG